MGTDSGIQWWELSFDDNYLKTYIDITTPAVTSLQIEFIIETLRPIPGSKILDLACGVGRHSIPLAALGLDVTGVDFSRTFIELAKIEASKMGLDTTFIESDMRDFRHQSKFDYVISMFTSFGYFDDSDNVRVMQNISENLRSGGALLIDLNNFTRTLDVMLRHGETDSNTGSLRTPPYVHVLSNGLVVTTVEEFAPETMRWSIKRSWSDHGKKREYATDVRMYPFPELKSLMRQAGLEVERLWGEFDGSSFRFNSTRQIILARKT